MNIGLEPLFIGLRDPLKLFCLYKQRRKAASKRTRHPGGCTDNFLIGRGGGEAHQNVLMGAVSCLAVIDPGV